MKKKGFTLIELLAVIVILAIIALIAVPIILNIIDKANKSAFKDTAYGIISAGELYFAERQLEIDGMETDKEFSLPSQANTIDGLQLKGNVPTGTVKVTTDGKVAIAIQNGRHCITKGLDDTDVEVSEKFENCKIPRKANPNIISASNECAINGQCTESEINSDEGVKVTVQVNESQSYDFYVISDTGTELTLIMSENLGDTVAWINASDYTTENNKNETPNTCSYSACNDEGPITAINYLDGLTDEEWSNITPKEYTYSGLNENGTRRYEDITRTMRARMITYDEANDIKTANNGTMPAYMYGGTNYWTSTAHDAHLSGDAWHVNASGRFNRDDVNVDRFYGVRPVIELSK